MIEISLRGYLFLTLRGYLFLNPSGVPGTSTRTWAWEGRGHDRTKPFGGTLGSGTRLPRPSGVPAAHMALGRTRRPSQSQSLFGGTCADLAESTARGGPLQAGPSRALSLRLSTHRNLAFSRRSGRQVHEEIEAKEGLPSADRNNKATLLLTGPFRTSKSSAKDLTPLVLKLQFAKYHYSLREQWRNRLLRR